MNTLQNLELVTEVQASECARYDASQVIDAVPATTNITKYVKDNTLTYYIAINTWLMCIREYDDAIWLPVRERILRQGLVDTIGIMNEAADSIISGCLDEVDELARAIYRAGSNRPQYLARNAEYNVGIDQMASGLFLLRYLRRFSPSHADGVRIRSLRDFIQTENRTKLLQRQERYGYPMLLAREIFQTALDWDAVAEDLKHEDFDELILSSGAAADASADIRSKLVAASRVRPEVFVNPFGVPYSGAYPQYKPQTWPGFSEVKKVIVRAVPKSYKAARIIAMEDVYRQSCASHVARVLQRHLPTHLDITDQGRNQYLAYIGSKYGTLATLDASHASDLISKSLVMDLAPRSILPYLMDFVGTHYEVDGQVRTMQMYSTSGNSLTFIIETLVYYTLAMTGCVLSNVDMEPVLYDQEPIFVSAYGDDTIVPSAAAETVAEVFSYFGLKINLGKSYYTGSYRESCGKEYMSGIDVTSIYYPRFPIVGSMGKKWSLSTRQTQDWYRGKVDNSTTMLIDLQKKLHGVSYRAGRFVAEVLKTVYPTLTSSHYGSICSDIWDFDDLGIPDSPRGYRLAQGSLEKTSVHPDVEAWWKSHRVTKHTAFDISYQPWKGSGYETRLLELYKYSLFLQYGPYYASPLDELLGVSTPRLSNNAAYGNGRLTMKLR